MSSPKNILSACLLLAPLGVLAAAHPKRQHGTTLDSGIKASGKEYFGTCTDPDAIEGVYEEVLTREFGSITSENAMKWKSLESTRGEIDFSTADELMDWAEANGKAVRGHTLVWHEELPSWVEEITDAAELTEVIEDHVATVVGRWAGQIGSWDVLNEILAEDGSLRESVFSNVLGEDFIAIAFNAARAADPDCKLYINDYNLDNGGYSKTQGMADLVDRKLADGVPIDGIGSQGHLAIGMGAHYQGALELLASTGVEEIAVTELDIKGAAVDDYTAAVEACLNVEKCVGITTWGISDADTWQQGEDPLLFDKQYEPKDSYDAVIKLFG